MDACSLCVCASSKIWAMCLKKRAIGLHPWTRVAGCLLNLRTMHAAGHPDCVWNSFNPNMLHNPHISKWQPASPRLCFIHPDVWYLLFVTKFSKTTTTRYSKWFSKMGFTWVLLDLRFRFRVHVVATKALGFNSWYREGKGSLIQGHCFDLGWCNNFHTLTFHSYYEITKSANQQITKSRNQDPWPSRRLNQEAAKRTCVGYQ